MVRDLIRGVDSLRRGFALLRSVPRLRRLALLPFLLNLVLFVVGVPLAVWFAAHWSGSLLPESGFWSSGAVRVVLELIVGVLIAVGALFLFSAVGSAIAAPFSALLSEAIEEHVLIEHGMTPASSPGTLQGVVQSLGSAFGRLFLFLLCYPPILALQLIPGAGVILFPLLSFLYGAFVLSFDFSDPTFERHIDGFRAKLRYLLDHRALYLGFGGGAVAMMLVPVLNLLLIPVCVAGGTLAYLETTIPALYPNGKRLASRPHTV